MSPETSSAPRAVFLSYASQDAEAAKRICEALRAAGVEVWFDQSELVGGDQWDAKIRGQVASCGLFLPVISAATQARLEGYFRIEWKLAAQRTHAMAEEKAFLLPVVVDGTRDAEAKVPAEFRAVQWTKLPGGETPAAFAERVKKLLGGSDMEAGRPRPAERGESAVSPRNPKTSRPWLMAAGLLLLFVIGALAIKQPWRPVALPPSSAQPAREAPRAAVPTTANSEARQLVLQGRTLLEQYVVDDTQSQNLILAEELAKRAVQLDAADADAWALTAMVASSYITTGRDRATARLKAFADAAERAIKLAPGSDEAQFAQAAAYRLQMTMRPEAERLLQELVRRRPTEKRYLRMLGNALRNRQALDEALVYFDRAAALPGGDARAQLSRAEALHALGRDTEAEVAADRSLAVQPTGAAYLFKVSLARMTGDLAKARAELAKVPPAVLLDDRGAAIAAHLWLWSHEPEKALAVLTAAPNDDFNCVFYAGPKSVLVGFAHQMAGREAAAKAQWRLALKIMEQRVLAQPANAADPLFLAVKMTLSCLIGDPGSSAENAAMLRLYVQLDGMGVTKGIDPAWEPVRTFTLLGRQDIMLDFAEMALANGEPFAVPGDLRTNPLYDSLRGTPRFEALLKKYAPEEKK